MNLYLLENTTDYPQLDVTLGYVIAALDESQARLLGSSEGAADEGAALWLDPEKSTCELVGHAVGTIEPYVVLRSFAAG